MHLIRRMQKAAFPLAAGGFRCATIASGERFHSTNYSNSSQSVGLGIPLTRIVVCSTVVGMTSMRRPRSVFTAPGVCSSSATASPYQWQMRSYTSGGEPDHYATLGVSPTSTPDEIKAAYKKMALEFHPDRNHAPDAEEKFKGISAAYQVIGNKTRRQEYDQQRRFSGGGGGGGAGPSGFPSGQSRGYPGGSYTSSTTQQQMSKEEADRLFRDIFGGMRVEDIFRNFEEELRRGSRGPNPGGLGGGFVGRSFGSREQVFRPFFSNTSSARIFTDAHGNRIEEHTFVDPRGRTYTSRRVSSTDPNASVNQTDEDYDSAHTRGSDGRVHFGRSSVNRKKPNMDFTQEMFNVRSHGRSPIMAFLILGAWTVVLCTMFYSMFHLLIYHPFFFLAILFLVMAGRRRPF